MDECIRDCAEQIYDNLCKKESKFVTIIVGAGASMSIKTSPLKDELIKYYGSITFNEEKSEHEKSERSKEIFNINAILHFGKHREDCTLEELFSIYSKIKGEKSVQDFLTQKTKDQKIFKRTDKISPNLGHEYLAHLVRHRLINIIITTNFDEEIEISLDDEIGRENYINVKSLSEFDAFNMEIIEPNVKLKKPALFKVHGTISYPRTIRITTDTVKKFEDVKLETIKWILRNTAILIIVGFSFNDMDFQSAFFEALNDKLLNEADSNNIKIYWIHRNEKNRKHYENTFNNKIIRNNKIRSLIESGSPIFITSDSTLFLRGLSENAESIDENKKAKMITTIARQNIRNLILNNSNFKSVSERKFCIEVIIFALTAKGLFGISALKDCVRLNRYCRELKKQSLNPRVLLDCLVEKNIIYKLKDHHDLYYLPDLCIQQLADKINEVFEIKYYYSNYRNYLIENLNKLKETFDVDIVLPDASIYMMFKDPKPIRNHMEWDKWTRDFFNCNCNEIKIIAQTGEWLIKDENKDYLNKFLSMGGKIKLIVCERFPDAGMHDKRQVEVSEKLKALYPKIQIRYLPWDLISEHIKVNNKNGMYMKRIAKSPIVAPVWVDNSYDLKLLEEKFEYYWNIAKFGSDLIDLASYIY